MEKTIKTVLVGAGGYGEGYVRAALALGAMGGRVLLAGIVEPFPNLCPVLKKEAADVPVFPSLETFFKQKTAELAVISSPIQFHAKQSILAMEHGCHVLCEKPVCATAADAKAMEETAARRKRHLLVGYQWSMCPAILHLKEDILAGVYGRLLALHGLVLWPRDKAYYARRWAGRIRDENGWILDSIVMNAAAHYLHNLLFLAGEKQYASAAAAQMEAFLARANNIEMYDTAALRLTLENGAMVSFLASHACDRAVDPSFFLQFERGSVRFGPAEGAGRLTGETGGKTHDYGVPGGGHAEKLAFCLDVLAGKTAPVPTVSAVLPHIACVNALSRCVPVLQAPPDKIREKNGVTYVAGMADLWESAYQKRKMPWDGGASWMRNIEMASVGGDFTGVAPKPNKEEAIWPF